MFNSYSKTNFEIIFIDDCSKDNTWEKLKQNTKDFKNTILLQLHKNVGQQNALSSGLDISKAREVLAYEPHSLEDGIRICLGM